MPHSSSFSLVNHASTAMSSLAVRSRIPVHVNDSVVPAAASHVHVNDSVVPAAASHPSVNTVDDLATTYSAMSIDKPTTVKPTSASPSTSHASKSKLTVAAATSASKGCPPLRQRQQRSLANVAPSVNSASVLDRIAERRQRVVANLASGSNRPTPPVKVTPTSTLKSSPAVAAIPAAAAVPEAVIPAAAVVEAVVPAVAVIPGAIIPAAVAIPEAIIPTAVAIHEVVIPATAAAAEVVIPAVAAVPEVVVPTVAPAPRRYRSLMYQMPANFRQDKDGKCHFIDRLVQISDQVWDSDCLIPSASTSRKPRARLPGRFRPATVPLTRTHIANRISPVLLPLTMSYFPRHFPPVYLTRRPDHARGSSPYCPARPRLGDTHAIELGYGALRKGRTCECCEDDGEILFKCFNIPPGQWETTPAESGVDTNPPIVRTDRPRKKVRFAEDLIDTFQVLKDPRGVFKGEPKSKDTSTRAKDFPEGFPFMTRRKIIGRR